MEAIVIEENQNDKEEQVVEKTEVDENLDTETQENIEEVTQDQQIEQLEEALLRAQAEVQNVRRIASQEVTRARLYGVESLAREFLAVGDNLQRAFETCKEGADFDSIKEGLELTLKSFENSLETAGIKPIDPNGEKFDSEKHEALSIIEDDSKDEQSVLDVIQRGFMIQGRVLRPAKVIVSKKSKKDS